jgi:Lrp/AsnC family transcriptional regulator, regulator for asnA, asnC and gidA
MTQGSLRPPRLSAGTDNPRAAKLSSLASPSDDLNKQIIALLQEDGRLPYDEMAARLGVSAGTVRNRVTRMREAGLLQIVAVVDPVAVDYETDAMLGIKTAPGVAPRQVAERLADYAAVVYIVWVSGQFDLLIEVVCDETIAFADFMNEVIYAHGDIAHVEVMTRIGMFKNQFLLKRHVT